MIEYDWRTATVENKNRLLTSMADTLQSNNDLGADSDVIGSTDTAAGHAWLENVGGMGGQQGADGGQCGRLGEWVGGKEKDVVQREAKERGIERVHWPEGKKSRKRRRR